MLNSKLVSRVLNGLKALTKDDHISKRYVLNVARQKAKTYISQKLDDRSIYREDNLYQTIDCFKLERIDVTRCDIIEFRNCKSIMKSVKKLPELIYSKYGNSLKEVTTIDNNLDFRFTTPMQWRRDSNRIGEDDFIRFYVKDNYLYLLNTEVEMVNLYLLTLETEKIEELSDCSKPSCKSLWDYEFVCPDKLLKAVIEETRLEISDTKRVTQDTNPNLDNNQKGKTVL